MIHLLWARYAVEDIAMGACLSSSAKSKPVANFKTSEPFSVIIAFPTCPQFSVSVSPTDKAITIRKQVIAEMERRAAHGEDFGKIEGVLVTVDEDTGDTVQIRDTMTIRESELHPGQYLWFQDKEEDKRVENILLRSSRLTENTSHNSRGVKQGMALIREEDEDAIAY